MRVQPHVCDTCSIPILRCSTAQNSFWASVASICPPARCTGTNDQLLIRRFTTTADAHPSRTTEDVQCIGVGLPSRIGLPRFPLSTEGAPGSWSVNAMETYLGERLRNDAAATAHPVINRV